MGLMRPTANSRSGLVDLLSRVGAKHLTVVEIGSYRGESAEVFLSTGMVDRLYCVDPWMAGYDPSDQGSLSDMAEVEADFDRRVGSDPRVVKVKGTIDDFVREHRAVLGSVDGVYIDGCHLHDAVMHDITVAMNTIRPLRFLAGHDRGTPGVDSAIAATLGDVHDTFVDNSWVVYAGDGTNYSRNDRSAPSRSAVVWASDGNDFSYARYSIASMRLRLGDTCDFFVLATPDADLHGIDRIYGVTRIDPTPYMQALGFNKGEYDKLHRPWVFAILYRLGIPLMSRFTRYCSVLYLDGDTFALPDSLRNPSELLSRSLPGFEVAGVPDMYLGLSLRNQALVKRNTADGDFLGEVARRVWGSWGTEFRAYVNSGVLLWNVREIDRMWYIRRCRYFWENRQRFSTFPDQDFVNTMMRVDASLPTVFNAAFTGGGAYVVDDACIRHCTGPAKAQMRRAGTRVPEFSIAARFAQSGAAPRQNPVALTGGRRCIVWCCDGASAYAARVKRSILSVKDKCGSSLGDVDFVVLADSAGDPRRYADISAMVAVPGVSVVDVSDLATSIGVRTIDDWRSGRLYWVPGKLLRVVVPFVPQLDKYDVVLYMDADTEVVDGAFSSIFSVDLTGYDCAMAGEFDISRGLVLPYYRVRFGKAFVRTADLPAAVANAILNRLNAGVYFNSAVFLANMPEMRRTFGSLARLSVAIGDAVRRGAPAIWHDIYNYMCNVRRLPGSYNAFGRTHDWGEPVYCVHAQGPDKDARYPRGTVPADLSL